MKKFRTLLTRETLLYIIFGAATTLVNYIIFFSLYESWGSLIANAGAFAVAVIFAFVVNKVYVFRSKSWAPAVLAEEIPGFIGARVGSFLLEEGALFLCESVLQMGRWELIAILGWDIECIAGVKLILSVGVVVMNYVFCKFIIFKKPEKRS